MTKHLSIFAIAALSVSLYSLHAQTVDSSAKAADSTDIRAGKAEQLNGSASATGNIHTELTKKVDTGNAAVGDQVFARTTAATTLSDGTKLPKGTQIVGHVTDIHAKSHADATSHLAFGLDRAVLHDGREIPIHAMLTSVAGPASFNAQAADGDMMSAPATSGGAGGHAGGGGLVGGVGRATGGALNSAGNVAGNTISTAGAGADGVVHAGGSVATGIPANRVSISNLPGVSFSSSANATESGSLDAKGRNISLDSGTQMTFNLSAAVR